MTNKISDKIKENAALIESALEKHLDLSDADYGILFKAMRYSALDGGKRIRPTLALEFCRMYGGKDEAALPFACAVELIHCYSLIHDDLPCMDNDDVRRGKPSCHKKFGEAQALLAGDALLTYAFELAASNRAVSAEAAAAAVVVLAKSAGADGMVGGQVMDMSADVGYDAMLKMNRKKTGALIEAACVLGCIAAGKTDFSAARRYASGVGLSFQIKDDIMDAGSEDDKKTFLTFMDIPKAERMANDLTADACAALEGILSSEVLIGIARYLLERKI